MSAASADPAQALRTNLQLYTVAEVAPLLRVSERHLYNLVQKRRVPHHKPNGVAIRFTTEDIRQIIEQGYMPVVRP